MTEKIQKHSGNFTPQFKNRMKKKIKFVQFEPDALLADIDFLNMTAEERGVYWTIITFLYSNGGKLDFDKNALSILTNCVHFEKVWTKIKKKFLSRNGQISHKRVSRELKRSKRLMQIQSEKGVKGNMVRWGKVSHSDCTAIANVNENVIVKKRKENITNTNTYTALKSSSPTNTLSSSLKFNEDLISIIRPRNQSDRTCFHKISKWLSAEIFKGRFNEKVYEKVLNLAKESAGARGNHAAIFMSLLKKELGYESNRVE